MEIASLHHFQILSETREYTMGWPVLYQGIAVRWLDWMAQYEVKINEMKATDCHQQE